jgi:hypothetical protein
MRISRSVVTVSGVVLAAGLITFTNPKAVHAVAAALVQVTNTASNPVPNSDVTSTPSQLVAISCLAVGCLRMEPGGALDQDAYAVPADQTLVITDVEIETSGQGGGFVQFAVANQGLIPSGGRAVPPIDETVANNGATYHISFSRGVVFPSGFAFRQEGSAPIAKLCGYLVPNG